MNDDSTPSVFDQVSAWLSSSVTVKLFMILILALLLLIPAAMIRELITERQSQHDLTVSDVSSNWAHSQQLSGPVITVPIYKQNPDGTEQWRNYVHLLPETLEVSGTIDPQELHRGIYEVIVYRSALDISASFDTARIAEQINAEGTLDWQRAVLTIGIPDMRGIEQEMEVRINNTAYPVNAGTPQYALFNSGVSVPLDLTAVNDGEQIAVQFGLQLQGSEALEVYPLGNNTTVALHSAWQDPSFSGAFLPDTRSVTEEGFTAEWKILQLNRNFPQVWMGDVYTEAMESAVFGVDLKSGADDYQKSMRSVKYAILTIALTFLVFFLTEILNKKRIHPFQYILVGLALCLFYVLLISMSEQIAFDSAYVIAAAVVVLMITLYSRTFYALWKHSLLLAVVLTGLYGYLYVTIQATDYALLMGAGGLTLMLALTMYFTRRVNWYHTSPA